MDRRRPHLRFRLAALAAVGLVGALPVAADDPVPAGAGAIPVPAWRPFFDLVERLHAGNPAAVGSLVVVPLWAGAPTGKEAVAPKGPGAWVGIAASGAPVLDLPAPVGEGVVRVSNPLPAPLLLPRGEGLVSPAGAARIVDRPTWLPAGGSAFVPVAQATDEAAPGPYAPTLDRASPATLRALRAGAWPAAVVEANAALDVPAERREDPLAGYASDPFRRRAGTFLAALDRARASLPAPATGLSIVDEGGVATLFLEGDAARFRLAWNALARGVALDAVVREARGAPPLPRDAAGKAVEATVLLLRGLREEPTSRPAFGAGEQLRWPAGDAPALWYGLSVDGLPIEATFHRPGPIGPGAVPPQPQPPGRPPVEPPPARVPGGTELNRRDHLTPFEERLRDRRSGGG